MSPFAALPLVGLLLPLTERVLPPGPSTLASAAQDPIALGQRPAHSFAAEPTGLPGLSSLAELSGSATLVLCVDPSGGKATSKTVLAAGELRRRYGEDVDVLLCAPEGAGTWHTAFSQRWLPSGIGLTTESLFRVPADQLPYCVVLDAFGEVVLAERAEADLDEARRAVEFVVSSSKSAEAYAPGAVGAAWHKMEKGLVQQGIDDLLALEKGSDPTLRQAAEVGLGWWRPRFEVPLARAERLRSAERWSEARELLQGLVARCPSLTKVQDPFAERVRAALAALPREGAALAADEALFALTAQLRAKGSSKALRAKLEKLCEDGAAQPAGARARALLERLPG